MLIALFAVALAQEPSEPPSDGVSITVRVGPEAIAEARDGVIDALRPLGWTAIRKGDVIVFKPPRAWLGRARMYSDGRFDFRRRVLVIADPPATPQQVFVSQAAPEPAYAAPITASVPVAILPSRRKISPHWEAAATAMWPALTNYRDVIGATATEERLAALPGQLDALWQQGTPLYGDAPLPDPASRRAALLDLWATRSATPEGRATAALVEAYLAEIVDRSATPTTPDERAAAEARRAEVRAADPDAAPGSTPGGP